MCRQRLSAISWSVLTDLGIFAQAGVGRRALDHLAAGEQAVAVRLLGVDVRRDPQAGALVAQDLVVGVESRNPRAAGTRT